MSQLFYKEFEVRWSDLDANRHLANSAYMNFMSHTRMAYLQSHGFHYEEMAAMNIGPVIFREDLFYFKEVMGGQKVFVTLELKGLSNDGMFFEFLHGMYNKEGEQHLRAELMGAFIDLKSRKLTTLPNDLIKKTFDDLQKTENFRVLTKEDTRAHGRRPQKRNPFTD